MKKIVTFLFCIGIMFNCLCQNTDFAVVETKGKIKTIDGIPVNDKTINLAPGKHKAETFDLVNFSQDRLFKYSVSVRKNIINFTVEPGKLYTLNSFISNFYDSTTKTVFFNHDLPQLIEEKTLQVVSTIDYPKIFVPFIDNSVTTHLYYDDNKLDTNKLALIQLSFFSETIFESFSLIGWTKDGLNLSYSNQKGIMPETVHYRKDFGGIVESNYYNHNVLLKPGNYKLEYSSSENTIGSNITTKTNYTLFFQVEPAANTEIDLFSRGANIVNKVKTIKTLRATNLNNIYFLPDSQHGWIVGEDGIIISTINGGKNWHFSQNGEKYKGFFAASRTNLFKKNWDIFFIDSLNGWICADQGTILHTKDGGLNWAEQNSNTNKKDYLRNVLFINKRFGFATKPFGFFAACLINTADGGETWRKLDGNSINYFIFNIDNIWKVSRSEILHSTDMCKNWLPSLPLTKVNAGLKENFIYFIDSLNGWILQDGVHCTIDGGKTWSKQRLSVSPELEITPDQVFFINKDCGWAITSYGIIFKTIDGGNNWLVNNIIKDITRVYFTDEKNGWIVGQNGFIYNTTDSGQKWNVMNVLDLIE